MKKILAFSSIRSDYDIMSALYKLLKDDEEIDFRIIVSGAHLSHSYGHSVDLIEKDGLDILLSIETLLDSDTHVSRLKSAALLLQNSLETINKFAPDLMLFAGDREDVLIYAMIGGYLQIPSIHFFGGDHVTDGYIDNPVRHATSKLSTAHFVTLPEHKTRLIGMGEEAERIFVIGNISLDKFVDFEPVELGEIKKYFDITEGFEKYALLIFHPVTEEIEHVGEYFENILLNLKAKNISAFVSYPNVDPGNHKLIEVIQKYQNDRNFIFYKNLERNMFMSIYKHADLIIGNSSSGIMEAASFKKPVINVGMRQTGRFADANVIFCSTKYEDIETALNRVLSTEFAEIITNVTNSYGNGDSARKAYGIIKNTDFSLMFSKKTDPMKVDNV